MAKKENTAAGQNELAPLTAGEKPKGGVDISNDWPFYKPEFCQTAAVYGHAIDRVEMPPQADKRTGEMRPWSVVLIKLLAPTLGVDANDQPSTIPAGEVIAFPVSYDTRKIAALASDPRTVHCVYIAVKGKLALDGGRSMWRFDMTVYPDQAKPRQIPVTNPLMANAAGAQLPGAPQPRQLVQNNGQAPQHGYAPTAQASEEIPF